MAVAAEVAEGSAALATPALVADDPGGELISDARADEVSPVAAAALLATGIGAVLASLESADVVLVAWLSSPLVGFGGKPELLGPEASELGLELETELEPEGPAPELETESGPALALVPLDSTVVDGMTIDTVISDGPVSAASARPDPIGVSSLG